MYSQQVVFVSRGCKSLSTISEQVGGVSCVNRRQGYLPKQIYPLPIFYIYTGPSPGDAAFTAEELRERFQGRRGRFGYEFFLKVAGWVTGAVLIIGAAIAVAYWGRGPLVDREAWTNW